MDNSIDLLWAAAVYASRVPYEMHGPRPAYVYWSYGEERYFEPAVDVDEMRRYAVVAIDNPELLAVSDYEAGRAIRESLAARLMFAKITRPLYSHEKFLETFLSMESVNPKQKIASAIKQISKYEEHQREDDFRDRIFGSEQIALAGTKIAATITVVNCFYSQKYSVYYVRAYTQDNHGVLFGYKQSLPVDSKHALTGKVKQFQDGLTRLNYVKLTETTYD